MRWLTHPRQLQRALLRRAAVEYARNAWPVAPGAYAVGDRFMCDRIGCPIHTCHPAFEDWQHAASANPGQVATQWSRRGHSVLFPTGAAFDVIEAPASLGEPAVARLAPSDRGPVAVTPTGRWMYLVLPGDGLRPELAERLDVVLHSEGSWVPAPPTRYPEGLVRWRISPAAVGWKVPYTYRIQRALVEAQGELLGHRAPLRRPAHVAGVARAGRA